MIGCLVTDGADAQIVAKVTKAATDMKAVVKIVAPRLGRVTLSDGTKLGADRQLAGGKSVLFDTAALVLGRGRRGLTGRGGGRGLGPRCVRVP